jgi:hypothetical protein
MGRGHLKREARTAYIEAIPNEQVFLIAIVFRGCWIDGIIIKKGYKSVEEVEAWLTCLNYFEELTGIALGHAMISVLGKEGRREIETWVEGKGKTIILLGSRNRSQAQVIIEGVKQAL